MGRREIRIYSGVGSGIPPEAFEGFCGSLSFELPLGGDEVLSRQARL